MDSVLEFLGSISWWSWIIIVIALVAIRDIFFQSKHTISHNFPVIGHFRYILEHIGPELRQYLVANNREELPFNRIERSWIYASAKNEHLTVLNSAGLFDTSHMAVISVKGSDSFELLQHCFTNDLSGCVGSGKGPLSPGRCVYGAFLTKQGTVVDDTIIFEADTHCVLYYLRVS